MYQNVWIPFELLFLSVILIGIITVPAETSDHGTPSNKPSNISNSTSSKISRVRNMWNIKNFNVLNLTLGDKLTSPPFSAKTEDNCNWMLDFYPSGIDQENKGYVALFINSPSCNVNASVRISFLNAKREQIYKREFLHDFSTTKTVGSAAFVKRDLLLNKKKAALLNNTLTIFTEVNATFVEKHHLGKDLAVLLENRTFSNFIISVGEKEFPAHKSILAARSPVFRAMFENNMKKKKITRIDIKDIDQSEIKKLLRYIYTGEAPSLEHLTPKLLAAADKYKVKGLKTICENAISANIKIANSAEFYILGNKYSAVRLKNLAKDFILAHAADVVKTPGFKLLIKAHPDLVEEIFAAVIKSR